MNHKLWTWWARLPLRTFVVMIYAWLYVPLAALVLYSFNTAPLGQAWAGWTLQPYHDLWEDTVVWAAVSVSLVVAAGAMTLCVLMGLLLVYSKLLTYRAGDQHAGVGEGIRWLFYPNVVIPELVFAVALLHFFAWYGLTLGFTTLLIGHTILGLGYAVPLIVQRYADIDPKLIEASLDLGATRWQTFVRVVLPLMKNSLIAAALLVFMVSFDDFVLSYFCAGAQVQTISLYLLALLRTGFSPLMSAFATLLMGMSMVLAGGWCWYSFRQQEQ